MAKVEELLQKYHARQLYFGEILKGTQGKTKEEKMQILISDVFLAFFKREKATKDPLLLFINTTSLTFPNDKIQITSDMLDAKKNPIYFLFRHPNATMHSHLCALISNFIFQIFPQDITSDSKNFSSQYYHPTPVRAAAIITRYTSLLSIKGEQDVEQVRDILTNNAIFKNPLLFFHDPKSLTPYKSVFSALRCATYCKTFAIPNSISTIFLNNILKFAGLPVKHLKIASKFPNDEKFVDFVKGLNTPCSSSINSLTFEDPSIIPSNFFQELPKAQKISGLTLISFDQLDSLYSSSLGQNLSYLSLPQAQNLETPKLVNFLKMSQIYSLSLTHTNIDISAFLNELSQVQNPVKYIEFTSCSAQSPLQLGPNFSLTLLDLDDVNFSDFSGFIHELIRQQYPNGLRLWLSHLKNVTLQDANTVFESLYNFPLVELRYSNNDVPEGLFKYLQKNTSLKELWISNSISVEQIPNLIPITSSLEKLILQGSLQPGPKRLKDGILPLLQALSNNTKLTELDVSYHELSDNGIKALVQIIQTTPLKKLAFDIVSPSSPAVIAEVTKAAKKKGHIEVAIPSDIGVSFQPKDLIPIENDAFFAASGAEPIPEEEDPFPIKVTGIPDIIYNHNYTVLQLNEFPTFNDTEIFDLYNQPVQLPPPETPPTLNEEKSSKHHNNHSEEMKNKMKNTQKASDSENEEEEKHTKNQKSMKKFNDENEDEVKPKSSKHSRKIINWDDDSDEDYASPSKIKRRSLAKSRIKYDEEIDQESRKSKRSLRRKVESESESADEPIENEFVNDPLPPTKSFIVNAPNPRKNAYEPPQWKFPDELDVPFDIKDSYKKLQNQFSLTELRDKI